MTGGIAGNAMGMLASAERSLTQALRRGSMVCLVGLWVLIAAGVLVRFVPVSSLGWADEIIELGFAWMVFLGTAALWRERTHFRVELIADLVAGSAAGRVLEIVIECVSLAFLLVFTYYGWVLALRATDRSPILEYTRTYFYIVMPVAGLMMVGYSLGHLWVLLGPGANRDTIPDARR